MLKPSKNTEDLAKVLPSPTVVTPEQVKDSDSKSVEEPAATDKNE